MRKVLLFATLLLTLPKLVLAWPFHISEGEQAAELMLSIKFIGATAFLTALSLGGIYAYRNRAQLKEKGFSAFTPFIKDGARFVKEYYLGLGDVYKDVTISSLRFIGSAIGALIDQSAKESLKETNKEITEGIKPKFSRPMYEKAKSLADKLDKKFSIPGEKKLLDKNYFYDPKNRGRSLGHIMGELQIMTAPVPIAKKGWKFAKQWNRLRQAAVGIKIARSAGYARAAINTAVKIPEVLPSLISNVRRIATETQRVARLITSAAKNISRRFFSAFKLFK